MNALTTRIWTCLIALELATGCTRPQLLNGGRIERVAVTGESDGLLRILVERQLTFGGIQIDSHPGVCVEINALVPKARMIGYRKGQSRRSSVQSCEAQVTRAALVVLKDTSGRQISTSPEIQARRNFDFESDQLEQVELAFSAGQLTIYDEAKHFASKDAEDELAGKIADWVVIQLNAQGIHQQLT